MKKIITIILLFLVVTKMSTSVITEIKTEQSFNELIEIANQIDSVKNKFKLIQERINFGYDEFTQLKVKEIAEKLNIPEQWLYDMFFIECRHNHTRPNIYSNAIGLIQFIPRTALWLGTTPKEISEMSKIQQLDLVYMYLRYYKLKNFNNYNKKLNNGYFPESKNTFKSKEQLYLAIFYPAALNKADFLNLGGEIVAEQNKNIDLNNDGQITKGELFKFVRIKV